MIEWLENAIDFSNTLNASISASWLIPVVIGLRFLLKKAPKWVNVALWGIVALRLTMPFSIESTFSLIPSAETVSEQVLQAGPLPGEKPAYLEIVTNPSFGNTVSVELDTSISTFQWDLIEMNIVWFAGMTIMTIYTVGTYLSLRRKLRTAVILRDNIFQCETVHSPFVLGILKPRIYLPYTIEGQNMSHVIAHEQAHIRRFDHWWKPLGFLLLTIHWFNPFVWVAYILLCRDIELACDEKVIAELGNEQRADYTQALVACAVNRRMIAACPLAFGEVGVKDRVKSIMNYRKPTFWIIVTALVVCVVVAVCFLTNPVEEDSLYYWTESYLRDIEQTEVHKAYNRDSQPLPVTIKFESSQGPIEIELIYGFKKNGGDDWWYSDPNKLHLGETIEFIVPADNHFNVTAKPVSGQNGNVSFRFTEGTLSSGDPRKVMEWFDYTEGTSGMSYEKELKIQLDEYPDITFKYTPYDIVATTSWEDSDLAGRTILISGLPIWNAYFCDLTGDGLPEICSQVSYGSGMIDSRVIVFDYANGVSYKLEDRGKYDYYLRMNGAYLYVDKRVYNSNEVVSSGKLVFRDGCIQLEGVDNKPEDITLNHDYFKANLFENNNEDIVGIISSVQNMEPAMTQNGDILIIQNEGGLWHFNEAQQLDVSVVFENDGSYMSMKSVGYIFCGDGNEGLYTDEIFADQNVYQSSGSFTAPETGNYLFYFRNYSSSWLTLQNFNVVYRNDLEVDRIVMVHSEEQWNPSAEATITNSEEIYHILSLYQSMQVEDYSRPLSEERIVIEFYRGEDVVQDWTVSYYAEDDTVVTCSDGFGLGNRRVTSDFSYDRLLRLFEEHAYTFIATYEPLGVSGDNVKELSVPPDDVIWQDGFSIDELAPDEEIVSEYEIVIEEDGSDLFLTLTWARQPLVLKYGIRAEDGTEYFQEKPGGYSHLRIEDIPAGTYHLFVKNSDAYHGIPAYENPEEFPDVSFNATGAILYAFDN